MFIQQIEVGRFAVFAYLLGGDAGGEGLVIDPADETDEIIALAQAKKITIKTILNTHAHVDHIMGNEEMKRKTGAKIIIHEDDAPLLTADPAKHARHVRRPPFPAGRSNGQRRGDHSHRRGLPEGAAHAGAQPRGDVSLRGGSGFYGGYALRRGPGPDGPSRRVLAGHAEFDPNKASDPAR